MTVSVGVIGLGRMARALICPLIDRGILRSSDVIGVVGTEASATRLKSELPGDLTVVATTDPRAVEAWNADVQLLAVKPQQLDAVADSVEPSPASQSSSQLLISVLAGVTLERLQSRFPARACVRAVPNTPCLVGEGLCGLAWGDGVTAQQRLWVTEAFQPVSEVLELPESRLDAFLALTSSGPAYVALVAEAMADGAVAAGLPRDQAHRLAHRTLAGTAALLDQQQLHPAQLKDMVASPGGTTMAALRKLENAGVRTALIEAVVAAAEHGKSFR